MHEKTAQKLLKKVIKDYSQISEEFDKTRQYKWKEFEIALPYIKTGQKLADLGCGNGRFYKFLKGKTYTDKLEYIGIDNNGKLLKAAKKSSTKAKFIKGDLLNLPIDTESIDIAIAIASLHHIPSAKLKKKTIQEIYRILVKNGMTIITVWNLSQPKYKKYTRMASIRHILSLGKYEKRDTFIPWGKSGVKRYYYAFKASELKKLLEENSFKIIQESIGRNICIIAQKV